jgi:hypothetical protein
MHGIVKRIINNMEAGRHCTVIFLDISQAFDEVVIKDYFIKLKTAFQLIFMPS